MANSPNNLAVTGPELANEWHPTKNGDLTPYDVMPGSHKRVWWVCERGHEWEALIGNRARGIGCPYCAGQKVGADNNLAVQGPVLAKEWHPTKNDNLTPYDVTPGSGKRAWWLCKRGHTWDATIQHRTHGSGCPYCSGRLADAENNFAIGNPDLANEWHPTKNGDLTPYDVMPGSHKRVWWVCERGHEWEARIRNRARGDGCPYCSGRLADAENNFAVGNPQLASEWHPTKNGELTPYEVKSDSHKRVWWVCERGHEWEARIGNRARGRGCPYCSGRWASADYNLAIKNPELIGEWHLTKNGSLTPSDVTPGSHKRVWWVCERGHEWEARIGDRARGMGCPYCAGQKVGADNNLAVQGPVLAKEWHPTKNDNLTPYDVTPGSGKRAWWLCKRGHVWEMPIYYRTRGSGCPACCRNDNTSASAG